MKRPVKCLFCKRQMYYFGDRKFEPEVEITIEHRDMIEGFDSGLCDKYYAHLKCWRKVTKATA